jgi:2'-hydroxyisoflavone reductase
VCARAAFPKAEKPICYVGVFEREKEFEPTSTSAKPYALFIRAYGIHVRIVSMPAPVEPLSDGHDPKKILILGGTGFIGPHVVDAALARGHTVTLFNRGKTHPTLFPDIEKLRGDRDGKLDALKDRTWDAVVDTSGFVPRIVRQSVELLAPRVGHYVFVSTMSVYANEDVVDADEMAEVQTLDDPATEDVSKAYGALKASCEVVCEAGMPGRVANLRTGWMVGPLDPTGRFTYWPSRLADGGDVLAPGDGSTPVQLIDARDIAAFILTTIENMTVGTFNVFGPSNHPKVQLTIKQLIEACNQAAGNTATPTWVDAEFLAAHDVTPWSELPGWLPASPDTAGFGRRSNRRAVEAGLKLRSVVESARDTLAWIASPDLELWVAGTDPFGSVAMMTRTEENKTKAIHGAGLGRDKEARVLAAWKARG